MVVIGNQAYIFNEKAIPTQVYPSKILDIIIIIQ